MVDIVRPSAPMRPAEPHAEARRLTLRMLCIAAVAVGVAAGLGAIALRALIAVFHNLAFNGTLSLAYDANVFEPLSPYGPFVILAPIVGGLIVVFLVETFAPEAKGHGVPEVMYAIHHKEGNIRGRVAVIKAFASALSIGTGASVGREGPIIQIGASFGSTLGQLFNLVRSQKITLLAAGAGAGIAATFNTPLGGVMFAVELMLPEVSTRTFLPVVIATGTATLIGRWMFGIAPSFSIPSIEIAALPSQNVIDLLAFAVLGALCGVACWAFVKLLAYFEDAFPKLPGNAYTQNIVGMLIVGGIMYGLSLVEGHYFTAGVGYATIQGILNGTLAGGVLLFTLALAKLFATTISLGCGASGGVFAPSLFIGATLGGAVGVVIEHVLPGNSGAPVAFAVVGMGAMVGGGTGAAMSAIIMVFEMTRDYNVIVPLIVAVAIALGVRRSLVKENIYTIKLRQRGVPIPTDHFANLFLLQPVRAVMDKRIALLPAGITAAEAKARLSEKGAQFAVIVDEGRVLRVITKDALAATGDGQVIGKTEEALVIARESDLLGDIISAMRRADRALAIVAGGGAERPAATDVAGVVDETAVARVVIRSRYD